MRVTDHQIRERWKDYHRAQRRIFDHFGYGAEEEKQLFQGDRGRV
jgi:hypothetical protein